MLPKQRHLPRGQKGAEIQNVPHNPPEVASFINVCPARGSFCTACGECVKACAQGVHEITAEGTHILHREKCIRCGACEKACPIEALKLSGREMDTDEVLSVVLEDKMFYETSGGGMTISGGEPTMQPEFTLSLLKAAKDAGLNTALDTCGLTAWSIYEAMLPYVDA